MESSDNLFHFTQSVDRLKSIVENGLWVRYRQEDYSFLRSLSDEIDWDQFWNLVADGSERKARSQGEGNVRTDPDEEYKLFIPMTCFCDIPHTRIHDHAGDDESTEYGPYAIVFEKEWGKKRGLNPMSYVVPESDFVGAFQRFEELTNSIDQRDPDWRLRSVFRKLLQFLKPYEDDEERYYDEREWRYIPSGVSTLYTKSAFESQHICRLHSTLCMTFDEIECLIVNDESETEDVERFLGQDLNGDAEKVPVRTFEKVQEHGVK